MSNFIKYLASLIPERASEEKMQQYRDMMAQDMNDMFSSEGLLKQQQKNKALAEQIASYVPEVQLYNPFRIQGEPHPTSKSLTSDIVEMMLPDQSMMVAPGVIKPVLVPLEKSLLGLPGKEAIEMQFHNIPLTAEKKGFGFLRPNEFYKEGLVNQSVQDIGNEALKNPFNKNPYIRELTGAFNKGYMNDLDSLEQQFFKNQNVNRDLKTVFNDIFEHASQKRTQTMNSKARTYKETEYNVSKMRGNEKTSGEYNTLDTCRGCLGFCPECYGLQKSNPMKPIPKAVEFTDTFGTDPTILRRIGEIGDASINPMDFKKIEKQYIDAVKSGSIKTAQDLDAIIKPVLNWNYTNEQVSKSGLGTAGRWYNGRYIPGGRDKTYYITKLQSIDGFNPDLVRNIQVSIDPLIPEHFFTSLKNIDALKKIDPNLNIQMRIRSVASANDEINALQKMAVDYANRNNIPVLETRLRIKSKDEFFKLIQALPEYYHTGSQYKHVSYYPSNEPELVAGRQRGDQFIKSMQWHTPDGPMETGLYAVKTAGSWKEKNAVYDIYDKGELVISGLKDSNKTPLYDAMEQFVDPSGPTGKLKIAEYAKEWSPLSKFGIRPDLHEQCNIFNMAGEACKDCSGCRAFAQKGEAEAIERAKENAIR